MKKKLLYLTTLFCLCLLALPTSASAKAKLKSLKVGKTYKYDVTRNGKKDKIKIKQIESYAEDGETLLYVYVNGKKKIHATGTKGAQVYAFTSGKKTVLLNCYTYGDGGSTIYYYYYKKNKFIEKELTSGGYFWSNIKVSGNNLRLYEEPKGPWWLYAFKDMESMPFRVFTTFKYKKGNLVKTTKYPGISGEKKFVSGAYLEMGSSLKNSEKMDGPIVENEDLFTLRSVVYKKGDYYYWIRNMDGESGWIKDNEDIVFYREYEY